MIKLWIWNCLIAAVLSQKTTVKIGVHISELDKMSAAAASVSSAAVLLQVNALPADPANQLDYDAMDLLSKHLESNDYQAVIGSLDNNIAIPLEKAGIPYLVNRFGQEATNRENTFFLLPTEENICDCALDIINVYDWQKIGIFYEDFDDTIVLETIMNEPDKDFRIWKLQPESTLQQLKGPLIEMRDLGIRKVLVLSTSPVVDLLLQEARRLGMAALPYSWIVINLGSEKFIGSVLEDLASNVSSVNLVKVQDKADAMQLNVTSALENAIILDSMEILAEAARNVAGAGSPVNANNMLLEIKKIQTTGTTGVIKFDIEGKRQDYVMHIYNYYGNNGIRVAQCDMGKNRQLVFNVTDQAVKIQQTSLTGRDINVVSIIEAPWLMLRPNQVGLRGNNRFEGFIPDMMDALSKMMSFTYQLYLVPDGNFGSLTDEGEWNGMIHELLVGNATMAASALSIDSTRESAIDFTKPFLTRHLNALVKTQKEEANFFQFLLPFSSTVWACIIIVTGMVCVILYFLEYYSTSLRSEGDDTPDMSFTESLWFTLAAILQQGGETTPATPAGRIVAASWWFFGLIIITSYTANLTAFLTVKNINPPISSVADLITQTKVQFGTVKSSGVENFFKYTKVEPYKTMWEQMVILNSNVKSSNEGVRLAEEGEYAFIWDSSVTNYEAAMNCDLTTIGPAFDHKGYGIALPPGTAYRDDISFAILRLIDDGVIATLEEKWWSGIPCPGEDAPTAEETAELTVHHVAGIYITLFIGLILAVVACIGDRLIKRLRERMHKSKESQSGSVAPLTPLDDL